MNEVIKGHGTAEIQSGFDELTKVKEEETLIDRDESDGVDYSLTEAEREEQITDAKKQVIDSIHANNSKKETIELGQFAGRDVKRELLGDELILLSEVKSRSKIDVIGKRKDKKAFEDLFFGDREKISEEELKNQFTPQVAALFVEEIIQNGFHPMSPRHQRMLEALPIEVQEKCFSKYSLSQINHLLEEDELYSESMREKTIAQFFSLLEQKEDMTNTDCDYVRKIVEVCLGDNADLDQKEELYNKVLIAYSNNPKKNKDQEETLKINLATLFDREYFEQNFDRLIDGQYAREHINFHKMKILQEAFGQEQTGVGDELQVKLDLLSPQLAEIAKQALVNNFENIDENLDEAKAKEIIILVDDCSKKVSSEKILLPLALAEDKDLNVLRQIQQFDGDIEPELEKNIEQYLFNQFLFERKPHGANTKVNEGVVNIEVTDLEQLKDWKELYDGEFEKALKEVEKEDSPDDYRIREMLARYLYGESLGELGLDLGALGMIQIENEDKRFVNVFDFNEKLKNEIVNVDMNTINQLVDSGELTEKQKSQIFDVVDFMKSPKRRLMSKYETAKMRGGRGDIELGVFLRQKRKEKTARMSANYSEYMQDFIEKGVQEQGDIEYDGKRIPLLEMQGDDFMFLVHHLGAYAEKNTDNPTQWNMGNSASYDLDGNPVGYISTAAIAPGCMHLAVKDESQILDPDEVFYGFTNFGEKTLLFASEYDLFTNEVFDSKSGSTRVSVSRQIFLDENPQTIIERTKQTLDSNGHGHNEVVLDRYSGGEGSPYGRLQPDYLMVFSNDSDMISDKIKKHAAYFGVPIMMVDYQKYKKGT